MADQEGKSMYLQFNTTGLIKAFFEALGKGFNPQYHYEEGDYDIGKIIDWKTGEELVVVGKPDGSPNGTREVKILVPGDDGESVLDNFIGICDRRRVDVYPF